VLKREAMDNEQMSTPNRHIRDRDTVIRSPTSGSDRQRARNKGLAWMSAITLGAGAASTLGAVAIAVTLPGPTVAKPASAAVSPGNNTSSSSDDEASAGSPSSDDTSSNDTASGSEDDSSTDGSTSQLQSGVAPSTTNNPPAATSGGS
jgi:hypothetical protein